MNNLLTTTLALTLLSGTSLTAPPKAGPIVVELFTSEGCSSCPPADALLSKLRQAGVETGTEVLILGEHVDYWNQQGWTDRFSSAAFTERQSEYARRFELQSPYTPQMVIDGHAEVSGNDASGVGHQLTLAAQHAKPAQIKLSWNTEGKLQVDIDGTADADGKVLLAITEDGLSTQVGRGENSGRLLQHNGVVRELHEIGSVRHGKFSSAVKASRHSDWKPENLRALVFVQKSDGRGDVTGAASLAYAPAK
jgi:hypothetical protein